METWKRVCLRLLYPGKLLSVLLPLAGFGLLAAVFILGWNDSPLGYGSYVLAFYGLVVLVLACIPLCRRFFHFLRQKQQSADADRQMRLSLIRSLMINVAYAGFNLLSGALYQSVWLVSNGAYYLLLSVVRLLLVRYEHKRDNAQSQTEKLRIGWSGFRLCGFLMLLMNLVMSGLVVQTILYDHAKSYHEIVVITVAAYTFYRLTAAIIRVVQQRKGADPIRGAARNINLTAAMMSLFTLQNTMLSVFGEGDTALQQMMNTLSGAVVCVLAVSGAAAMVRHGAKRKKELDAV